MTNTARHGRPRALGPGALQAGALIAGLLLVGAPPSAIAADNEGPAFINDQTLSTELLLGETESISVPIVQGSATRESLRLLVVSLGGPEGGPPLSLEPPPPADGRIAASDGPLGPGELWSPTLTFKGAVEGTFTGTLIVIDSVGRHDMRSVAVAVAAPSASLGAEVLVKPLPPTITIEVTRLGPGPIGPLILPPSVRLEPRLAKTARAGPLVGLPGVALPVGLDEQGRIIIADTPASGEFVGVIAGPGDDGLESMAALVVKAKDLFVWALLTILVGIAIASWGEDLVNRRYPRLQLEARLAQLRRNAQDEAIRSADLIAQAPAWHGANREAVRILDAAGVAGVLAVESQFALRDFDALPSLELRESRWGVVGTETRRLKGLVDSQVWVNESGLSLNDGVVRTEAELGEPWANEFRRSALGRRISSALAGSLMTTQTQVDELQATRGHLGTVMMELDTVARAIRSAAAEPLATDAERAALGGLIRRLSALPMGSEDDLRGVVAETRELYAAIKSRRPVAPAGDDGEAYDEIESDLAILEGADTGGGGYESLDLAVDADVIAEKVRSLGRRIVVATVMAVVATGLITQYLPSGTFGTLADYGALLVWATAATAAGQVLRHVASSRATQAMLRRVPVTGGATMADADAQI